MPRAIQEVPDVGPWCGARGGVLRLRSAPAVIAGLRAARRALAGSARATHGRAAAARRADLGGDRHAGRDDARGRRRSAGASSAPRSRAACRRRPSYVVGGAGRRLQARRKQLQRASGSTAADEGGVGGDCSRRAIEPQRAGGAAGQAEAERLRLGVLLRPILASSWQCRPSGVGLELLGLHDLIDALAAPDQTAAASDRGCPAAGSRASRTGSAPASWVYSPVFSATIASANGLTMRSGVSQPRSPPLVLGGVDGFALGEIIKLGALLKLRDDLAARCLRLSTRMWRDVVFASSACAPPASRTRRAAPARWASCPSDSCLDSACWSTLQTRQLQQEGRCRRSCPIPPCPPPATTSRARIRLSSAALRCCGVRSLEVLPL